MERIDIVVEFATEGIYLKETWKEEVVDESKFVGPGKEYAMELLSQLVPVWMPVYL